MYYVTEDKIYTATPADFSGCESCGAAGYAAQGDSWVLSANHWDKSKKSWVSGAASYSCEEKDARRFGSCSCC